MSDFERSIAFVFKWEGGYTSNPADPGGETKYGISKRAYPDVDIAGITEEQAKAIYKRDYWEKAGCDNTPWPLCLAVFDTAVNMGVKRAQSFKTQSKDDWTDYLFLRIEFYCNLKKPEFLRGWINRVTDLYRTARI